MNHRCVPRGSHTLKNRECHPVVLIEEITLIRLLPLFAVGDGQPEQYHGDQSSPEGKIV